MYWFYKIDMAKKIISLRSFEIYNKSALKKNMPNADGISKTRHNDQYSHGPSPKYMASYQAPQPQRNYCEMLNHMITIIYNYKLIKTKAANMWSHSSEIRSFC